MQKQLRPVVALACDYKHDRLWVQSPLGEVKHLLLSLPHTGNKAELLHSTHNASRIENGKLKCINGNSVKLKKTEYFRCAY